MPSFTIQPGQYVLIQQAIGSNAGTPALPQPLIVPTSGLLSMAAAAGKVALVSDALTISGIAPATANVVDLVGYGAANGFEGGGPTPATSNVLAVFRGEGGCTDTDNNQLDFTAAAPAPRTSESARNVCGGVIAQPIATTCPASLGVALGTEGRVSLSANDPDSAMLGASISGDAIPGISLGSFMPAADGRSGSIELVAGPSLADGVYPVVVRFTSDGGQEASCTVSVRTISPRSIPTIQGAGDTSAYNNAQVITTGVVTHKVGASYFLQDPDGDGDPATSDALFIFTGVPNTLAVGDLVRVTGTITEYRPSGALRTYTEMKDVLDTVVLARGRSITPTNIDFAGSADLPRLESMLVNITNPLTVNQTSYLGDRGELTLSVGRRENASNRFRPGTPEALALAADNSNNELVLDDSIFVTPASVPYLGENGTVRAGDTVTGLTGVLDFGSVGGGRLCRPNSRAPIRALPHQFWRQAMSRWPAPMC